MNQFHVLIFAHILLMRHYRVNKNQLIFWNWYFGTEIRQIKSSKEILAKIILDEYYMYIKKNSDMTHTFITITNRNSSRSYLRGAPPKIGENMIFWHKIVIFHTTQCLKWTVAQSPNATNILFGWPKAAPKLGSHWPNNKRLGDCLKDR